MRLRRQVTQQTKSSLRPRRIATPVFPNTANTVSLRTRRVLTPVSIGHPNIRRQTKSSSNDADGEQSDELKKKVSSNHAGDENLEERIRSALSTPATLRKTHTPGSIKSVRWDPAIVSCGPITPVPSPSSKVESSKSAQSQPQPASLPPKRGNASKDLVMESLARLKKRDKDTLRRLLGELKDTESEGKPITESDSAEEDSRSAPDCNSALLNDRAAADRRYATLKAQLAQQKARVNLGKAMLTVPRKRPHIQAGNSFPQRNPQEPTWVNIFNPPPHIALPHDAPAIPRPAPNVLHQDFRQPPTGYPPSLRLPTKSSANHWDEGIPGRQMPLPNGLSNGPFAPPIHPMDPPQPIWLPMPIPPPCGMENLPQFGYWVNPFGFQTPQPALQPPSEPAASRAPSTISRRPFKPKGGRGPMVDVGPEFLPSEEEPGREARAIESGWAKSLLAKFQEKYPQTGKVKAGPLAPGNMRQAAAIQQRLEFILYQQKERNVGQRSSDEQPPCYEVATGERIAFSDDERVASDGKKPVKDKKNFVSEESTGSKEQYVFVSNKEGEALAQHASKVKSIKEENSTREESPAIVFDDLSDSFSKLGLDDEFAMVGC